MTKPCKNCPFRNDIRPYITGARAEEISEALLNDKTFTCHKYSHSLGLPKDQEERHCAGAMIVLEKMEKPNQWMRWMERIGKYNYKELDMGSPVYTDLYEFIEAHELAE